MDTLCGLGLPELVIVALLAFVVIGPQRSREVALRAGRFLRSVITSSWWKEFNQVADSVRNLPTTLVRMAELEEAQADLRRTMSEIGQDARPTPPVYPSRRAAAASSQPDNTEAASDPWGIMNATADTRHAPRPEAQDSTAPPADETTPDA
jgi:Sec-independent protein translocase protein TatA